MKKIIKNKRGDLPIIILVLGVFLICMIALGSFLIFENKIKKIVFTGTDIIERASAIEDKYYFYKNTGKFSEEKIEEILGIQKEEDSKYIYIEQNSSQGVFGPFGEEKKVASVKYYLP
jgi:hypothetical protein